MSQSILEIIFKTVNQGQGGKAAAAELKELKGTVGEASQAMLGLNLGSLSAVGALTAIGAAANTAVVNYQAYAEEMRGMALITGTGVEATSRLVQAFDDMGVEQAKVQSVMETAARKGFVMSIENVAMLADEYNALTSQQEKNKLLTDKLGKSGLELAKAFSEGGQAIRDAAASQADGMIVTEQNIRDAEELRAAQDNLNDSLTALSNTFAKIWIPIVNQAVEAGTPHNVTIATMNAELEKVPAKYREGARRAMEFQIQQRENNRAGLDLITMISAATEGIAGYSGALENSGSTMGQYKSMAQQVAEVTQANQVGAVGASEAQMQYVNAIDSLTGATGRLQEAQKNWQQGAGGDVKAELEAQGIKGEKLKDALRALDVQYGTSFAAQAGYKEDVTKLVAAYKQGGEEAIPKFIAGLGGLETNWASQSKGIQEVRTEIINLQSSLDLLVSKSYNVAVNMVTGTSSAIYTNGGRGKTSSNNSSNTYVDPLSGPGGANGLDFTVPPGYPNDSFPIRVQSGEHVKVTPAGQTTNMGGVTIYVSGAGDPNAVANAISLRLASYGKQYQGG